MSETNVLDVFMSVKVKKGDFKDLVKLRKVLEGIVKFQKKLKTPSKKIKIEAETDEIEKDIEEIKDLIKGVPAAVDKAGGVTAKELRRTKLDIITEVLDIKQRLFNVYSAKTSDEQTMETLIKFAKKGDIFSDFFGKARNINYIEERAEDFGIDMDEYIKGVQNVLLQTVQKDLKLFETTGTVSERARSIRDILMYFTMSKGATSPAHAKMFEALMKLVSDERTLQRRALGPEKNVEFTEGGETIGMLQQQATGWKSTKRELTPEMGRYLGESKQVKLTREQIHKVIRARTLGDDVSKDVAHQILEDLETDEKRFFAEDPGERLTFAEGALVPQEIINLIKDRFGDDTESIELINSLYTTRIPDAILSFTQKLSEMDDLVDRLEEGNIAPKIARELAEVMQKQKQGAIFMPFKTIGTASKFKKDLDKTLYEGIQDSDFIGVAMDIIGGTRDYIRYEYEPEEDLDVLADRLVKKTEKALEKQRKRTKDIIELKQKLEDYTKDDSITKAEIEKFMKDIKGYMDGILGARG